MPSLGAGQTDNFSGEFQSTSDNLTFVTSILLHPTIIFNTESQYNYIQNIVIELSNIFFENSDTSDRI